MTSRLRDWNWFRVRFSLMNQNITILAHFVGIADLVVGDSARGSYAIKQISRSRWRSGSS